MKTEFKITFADPFGNWYIKLHTTETKNDKEVSRAIYDQTEITARNVEEYSPCEIMDDLCENHPGWWWEDWLTDEDVYVFGWRP